MEFQQAPYTAPVGLLFASIIEEWLYIDGVDKNDVAI